SIFKVLCGITISDTQTGLRVIGKKQFPKLLEIRGERYEYESNMLLELHSAGVPFTEVEIETVYEDNNSCSHFRPVRDSVRIYKLILAHVFRRLFRFFKYVLSSCASAAVDLLAFWLLHMLLAALGGDAFAEGVSAVWLCTFVARAISSFVNFNLNKSFVFTNKSNYGATIIRYYILCIIQLCVSAALVWLLGRLFSTSASWILTLLKALVDTVLFFISYRIQKLWVFKNK
ncbi:MAG: GtrA family protein, partial [Oscillospiraceae bacterium]|nr:GtrA family protein [Oscillospiraceae bacterium]